MSLEYPLPDLKPRLLPPENWQRNDFLNPKTGHNIHYSFVLPENGKPNGIIVTLPGLSEFGEKYIETARFFSEQNYGFYVIDWAYQGRSMRFKENPQKRHSDGYETDISDLHYLISNIIKTDEPLYMLAHSMGSNIGLRYLIDHPAIFKSASFSAPMLGIRDLKYCHTLTRTLLRFLTPLHSFYVPDGKNWSETDYKTFSHDPVRAGIQQQWSKSDRNLRIGNSTLKWIYESLKSIDILQNKNNLGKITIPVLLATADKEGLIDNAAIRKASQTMPDAKLLKLTNSKHEILMETDAVRDLFLNETLKLFNQ